MLILRRKKNEAFLIGNDIRVTILECAADGVRIAIDAPRHISILREELSEAEQLNRGSLAPSVGSLLSLQSALSKMISHNGPDEAKSETTAETNDEP